MQFIKIITFTIAIYIAFTESAGPPNDKIIVCQVYTQSYLKNLTNNRFKFQEADFNLCTHVISMDEIGDEPWTTENELLSRDWKEITSLRNKYPHLKISISVKRKIESYWIIVESSLHNVIAKKYSDFVISNDFDGMNLQYDLDEFRNKEMLVEGFNLFLKALNETFEQSNLLLTVTILVSNRYTNNFKNISNSVNFINLVQKYKSSKLGYSVEDVKESLETSNFEASIDWLIQSDVPPSKIVAGIHFSGPVFSNFNNDDFNTLEKFVYSYQFICSYHPFIYGMKKSSGKANLLVFTYNRKYRIIMESSHSIANKVRIAMNRGLAGIAAVSMPFDDIYGKCGSEEDIYKDFKTDNDVILKIPIRKDFSFTFLRTINEVIMVLVDEMEQEENLIRNHREFTKIIPTTESKIHEIQTFNDEKTSEVIVNCGQLCANQFFQGIDDQPTKEIFDETSDKSTIYKNSAAFHSINGIFCVTLMLFILALIQF